MKSSRGIITDSQRSESCRLLEEASWEILSDELYRLHYATDAADRDEARRVMLQNLERTLQEEVRNARKELAAVDPQSRRFDADEFKREKHRHRRSVAGYYQVIELLKQGDDAFRGAMLDGLMIFEGHRCVCMLSLAGYELILVRA